jgi:hypothetical protein
MKTLLLLLFCMIAIHCLQLTSHKQNLKNSFYQSHQGISYYGRHYLSHRSKEYIQQVKKDNLEKIQPFNAKNKQSLQKIDGDLVKGRNSYVMGKKKFFEFTKEEFVHTFTGFIGDEAAHSHMKS